MPYPISISFEYLYLSGMWLGVAPRTDIENTYVEEIGLHFKNMITF